MTSPLISCVIPVYNGECYLQQAVDSVLGQTHAPLEVIVVDDGSTDGTRAVMETYEGRVHYRYQANAGHAVARNLGVTAAHGEFVAFLDADDLWHREKLERQLACFRQRPALDACVTLVRNFWSPEIAPEDRLADDARLVEPVPGFRSVTLLARRALFDAVGQFDPTLRHGNDTDWFLRAAERGAVITLLPEVLVDRRLHHSNRSRRLAAASQREYVRILKASLDRRRLAGASPLEFPTEAERR